MKNTISNIKEDSLLVWLDNSLEKTQTELDSQISAIAYWRSHKYKQHASHMHMSETDVKDYRHKSELQCISLAYRLNWINQEIEKLKK